MRKFFRRTITAGLFLILVLVALPFIVPLDTFKPELESQLSTAIGRQVMIDRITLEMLPRIDVRARGITIWGRESGDDQLFAREMRVIPDLPTLLFDGRFSIQRIHIAEIETNQSFARAFINDWKARPHSVGQTSPVAIDEISADGITFRLDDKTVLGPYNATISLTHDFGVREVSIHRRDKTLRVRMTVRDKGIEAFLSAHDWTVPIGRALRFSTLRINAFLPEQGHLDIKDLHATAYNGTLAGSGRLTWKSTPHLAGHLDVEHVAMEPIIRLYGGRGFSGDFGGQLDLVLRSTAGRKPLSDPHVSGNFRIANARIHSRARKRAIFKFDELTAHGSVDRHGLVTKDTALTAYGGTATGNTATSWANGWRVDAELNAHDVNTASALAGFVDAPILTGRFNGRATIGLAARRFRLLTHRPTINGEFEFRNGVFYKADLQKASTALSKEGTSGGQTRFKKFAGTTTVHDGEISLRNLSVTSAALSASGHMEINRNHRLRGEMEVGLRQTANLISIPLILSGTTADPRLRPTNSAVIGGMVGTSVLGPGVGTAVGIKVGDMFKAIGSAITHNQKSETDQGRRD